ncbi:MAG: CinA family nicotinamide mononucleotide deamidase-related protein, partial [Oscillospiraceae bacterium]
MNAEILCVGTELLLGDVVNTNASDVAKELASLGINVYHHEVVGDNPERLKESLDNAFKRADLVVLTGGLGPTYDDLTKETVAAYFGRKLKMDEVYLEELKGFFAKTGRPMTENNIKQAMMPENSTTLSNPYGTAPGCAIEGNGKIAILMPGPPREMRPMLKGPVRDFLQSKSSGVLTSEVLNVFLVGESTLEHQLRDIMVGYTNPTVAPYAKTGECQLRITASADTREEGLKLIAPVKELIKSKYTNGEIYGENFESLPNAVLAVLTENHHTLAVSESLTGG